MDPTKTEKLESAMYLGVKNNDAKKVESLIQGGVDCDIRFLINNFKLPAICLAVTSGSKDVVQVLCDSGCSVHQRDVLERTPLHLSLINRNYPIMKILLKYNARVDTLDAYGQTPVMAHLAYMTHFAGKGPHSKAADLSALDQLLSHPTWRPDLEQNPHRIYALFFELCMRRKYYLAKLLLEHKYVVFTEDIHAYHLLQGPVLSTEPFNEDFANLLLQFGCSLQKTLDYSLPIDSLFNSSPHRQFEVHNEAFAWCLQNGSPVSRVTFHSVMRIGNMSQMRNLILYRPYAVNYYASNCTFRYDEKWDLSLVTSMVLPHNEDMEYWKRCFNGGPTVSEYTLTRESLNVLVKCGLTISIDYENPDEISKEQIEFSKNVNDSVTLQDRCRIAMLQLHGTKYYDMVTEMDPPQIVKRYLLFDDLFQK